MPERQFLARLRSAKQSRNPKVELGIGDDCAILQLPPGQETLITTDFSLEAVHFRRDWQSPECIGHRCLARGLSDIAAMGGNPVAAFLSLALPRELPHRWVDGFFAGLLKLARRHGVQLAGGDTSQSLSGVLADITVVGSVRRGEAIRRSSARVGDLIYVTGVLGESAAMLHQLAAGMVKKLDVFPNPRVAVGDWLTRKRIATAAIDISDGLSTDLTHICEESGVGAVIEAQAIPIHSSAKSLQQRSPTRDLSIELALHGGEDYEILFTSPKSKQVPERIAGVRITKIGQVIREKNMYLSQSGEKKTLEPRGWEHFQSKRRSSSNRD